MKDKYLVKNGKEVGLKAIEFEKGLRQILNENFESGVYDVDIAGLHLLFEQILYEVFSDKRVQTYQKEFEISEEHNRIDREMRKLVTEIYGNNISDIEGGCILMCIECLKWEYYDHLYRLKRQMNNPIIAILNAAMPMTEQKKQTAENGGYHS